MGQPEDDGKWYYMLDDGTMVTGWPKIGDDYYFMRGNGTMGTGWREMDGAWYFFQSNGKCVVNSWAQIKTTGTCSGQTAR